jgi:tRNA-intron endonuclease
MEKIKGLLSGERVIAEDNNLSRALYDKSRFGEPQRKKFVYALVEALYLMEEEKMEVVDGRGKVISYDKFVTRAKRVEPNFWIRYCVYREMRSRGYIVKTALKFGADFRVYDRGVKPGEDHAKWILYPVYESQVFSWYDFAAKNRVAHSTRKKLLLGIVDAEESVTFYEISWTRP